MGLLKDCVNEVAPYTTNLFNLSLSNGVFSANLREQNTQENWPG